MTLTDRAVLEIDLPDAGTTGVFELQDALNIDTTITRSYLAGGRGATLRNVVEQGDDLIPGSRLGSDPARRRNYYLDAGAGTIQHTYSFERGLPATISWGDGSVNTQFDATEADARITAKQVFDFYVSQSALDSRGNARLYYGEWSDGTHADVAGRFGRPMNVTVPEANTKLDPDEPSAITGTVTVTQLLTLPNVDVPGLVDDIEDTLADLIPDF